MAGVVWVGDEDDGDVLELYFEISEVVLLFEDDAELNLEELNAVEV